MLKKRAVSPPGFCAVFPAIGTFISVRLRFRHASPETIRAYQTRMALAQVRFAARRSVYFRELYSGMDLADFASLPTTNKAAMMERLGDYITIGLSKEEILDFCLEVERTRDFSRRLAGYTCVLSTGTSGSKGVEIVSRKEELILKAAFLARFPFPESAKLRAAFILRVFSPGLKFAAFGHKVEYVDPLVPFPEMVRRIDGIGPNLISGPPQVLKLLAAEKRAGRLRAAPLRIVSYGETLWPDVRAAIESAFACRVDEIYKCTEAAIAMPCRDGRLHVNEDLVLLEVLDAGGNPARPGEPGARLLVTDLMKRSCPIIRYELNDIVTISPEPCPCGSRFRVIESIRGRTDDTFWLPSAAGEGLLPVLPDFVARAVVACLPEALEWCAVQEEVGLVRVTVETRHDGISAVHAAALRERLSAAISASGCVPPYIVVETGPTGAGDFDRKFRRVRRSFAYP